MSQRQVAEALKRDRSVVSRNVHVAIDQGFLANLAPGQGREARLVMGDRELPAGSALPDPVELGAGHDDGEQFEVTENPFNQSSMKLFEPPSEADED